MTRDAIQIVTSPGAYSPSLRTLAWAHLMRLRGNRVRQSVLGVMQKPEDRT